MALGFCALHTTIESQTADQPFLSDDRQLALIFDGYLHRLSELRSELEAKGAVFRTKSDAEVVLHAYQVWGHDCPAHLCGEYAFVIWDARRRLAYCARDHAGLRPLHYHWDGKSLVVASDVGGVLAAPSVSAEINKSMLAQILADEWITRGETIWKDVESHLPATWATFGRDGQRSGTYWHPSEEVTIRYGRDEDYVDHYIATLEDAVRESSRSHLPVACDVSGGLDSSAIFGVAERLRERNELPCPRLFGYTFKFDDGSEADELSYARAVASHLGVIIEEVDPFLPDLDWFTTRGLVDRDLAPFPNASMSIGIGEALVRDGCRVSLNGEGGDEWLSGRHYYLSEQLSDLDLRSVFRNLRLVSAESGFKKALYLLARYGFFPSAPRSVRATLRRFQASAFADAYWLHPDLRSILEDCRRHSDPRGVMKIANMARRCMLSELRDPGLETSRNRISRQSARVGYEPRYPMYSRGFVEFAFSTPENIRMKGSRKKQIHVEAMKSILPAVVSQRQSKADFSIAFHRHFENIGSAFARMSSTSRAYVDPAGASKLHGICRGLPVGEGPIWELWAVFACLGL